MEIKIRMCAWGVEVKIISSGCVITEDYYSGEARQDVAEMFLGAASDCFPYRHDWKEFLNKEISKI